MQLMSTLILLFAFSIGYATFIENDFGRTSAKALIYNAWWFEMIFVLLTYALINNLIKYKLFRIEKIAALTFHLSFILILIGAGITRYISYEGMMHIREGESTDQFISDNTFLQIHINDTIHQLNHAEKLLLSGITKRHDNTPILKHLFSNYFSLKLDFKDHDIKIEYFDFLPNVKDSKEGVEFSITSKNLELTSENGTDVSVKDMDSKKMVSGENILFKDFEFTLNNPIEGALNFYSKGGKLICDAPSKLSVMSMPPDGNGATTYIKGDSIEFLEMSLIKINSVNFVISDIKIKKQ